MTSIKWGGGKRKLCTPQKHGLLLFSKLSSALYLAYFCRWGFYVGMKWSDGIIKGSGIILTGRNASEDSAYLQRIQGNLNRKPAADRWNHAVELS